MSLTPLARYAVIVASGAVSLARPAAAQAAPTQDTASVAKLFRSETPLAITLTTNIKRLRNDRSEGAPYHSATITYAGKDGKPDTVAVKVKTHGIWRLKHCDFPPLRFSFSNKVAKHTPFHDLQRPKFVNVCYNRDSYEQLILQEFQLYRIYQVVTPVSHHARLLRVTYADSGTGKVDATRYAFLIEDPDKLAERLGGTMAKTKGAGPSDIDGAQAAIAFLFQYMIGNTDFSFNGLHNGELVMRADGSDLLPVAYDFDFSGAVNAPYATVDPRLSVKRVRDRLFRGYCTYLAQYPDAIALFQQKRPAIYALYHDEIGKLMDQDVVKETLEYFDAFYDAIKSPRDAERNVLGACQGPR